MILSQIFKKVATNVGRKLLYIQFFYMNMMKNKIVFHFIQ
jgi:hypothetical protein